MIGLGASVNNNIAVDPSSGRVYIADTDHTLFWSTDNLHEHIIKTRPDSGAKARAVSLDFDTGTSAPRDVWVALGEDPNGEVWIANPRAGNCVGTDSNCWTSSGLQNVSGGKTPLGIKVFYDGNGQRIAIAAVEGAGGIYRKVGSNSWTKITKSGMFSGAYSGRKAWIDVSGSCCAVFVYDKDSGAWRSTDAGATWSLLWGRTASSSLSGALGFMSGNRS